MIKTRTFLLPILLLFALSGCSSLLPAQTELSMVISDNSFQPGSWRVPSGAGITLHITNYDSVTHDLQILFRQAVIPYGPEDASSIYWQHQIAANTSETVHFTAPAAAGDYDVIGADALQDGMVARLTVLRLDQIQP